MLITTKYTLRKNSWLPQFVEVDSWEEVADYINRPHEDYPERVLVTLEMLLYLCKVPQFATVSSVNLQRVHSVVGKPMPFRGKWREVSVTVGDHVPPPNYRVPDLMKELEQEYSHIRNIDELRGWYLDLQTIHPWQDFNGRVGGIFFAINAYLLTGKLYGPLQ
jgi:hypothetical protein